MLRLNLALIVAAFPIHAVCQAPEHPDASQCATAAERVHANSPREKAWGAHLAAVCRIPNLAADVAGELDRMHPDMSGGMIWNDSQWAVEALLDALIQLNQPLDATALRSISQRFPTEGTILMLQDATRNSTQLARVREAPAPVSVWTAASNALTRLRSPGFAAALLKELRLTNSVWISDTGRYPPEGTPGHGFLSSSYMHVPPGFPPVGIHWLTAERAPGDVLVSGGRIPVYSRRTVLDPGVARTVEFPEDGSCLTCGKGCPECQTARVGYLAELARLPAEDVARAVYPLTEVPWSNPAQVNIEISRSLTEQEAAIRRLAKQLVITGVLDASELEMTLQLAVLLNDRRSNRSVPLPRYLPIEFHIR